MATKAWKNWSAEEITSAKLNLMQPVYDTFANIPVSPTVGMVFIATDTTKLYVCFVAGSWVDVSSVEAAARVSADGGKVNNTGNETINGIKTFGSIPLLPASDPSAANEATRKSYVDAKILADLAYVAGDVLICSNDDEKAKYTDNTYTKAKEMTIARPGVLRVKFDLKMASSASGACGRIYKNGTAVGTERTASDSYVTYSEDLSGLVVGDKIQLYYKSGTAGGAPIVYVRNFRLYSDYPLPPTVDLS